jgi:hypothetical protein
MDPRLRGDDRVGRSKKNIKAKRKLSRKDGGLGNPPYQRKDGFLAAWE